MASMKRKASLSQQKIKEKAAAKKRMLMLDKLAHAINSENTDADTSYGQKLYVSIKFLIDRLMRQVQSTIHITLTRCLQRH